MTPEQIKEARALVDRLDGYTPGPWTVERFGSYRNNDGTMFETWKISPQRSVYGSMFENDARLAAVAPDLHATLTAALDEIERLRAALGDVIDCDHHNFTDGPPPRYVRISREALKGSDQ